MGSLTFRDAVITKLVNWSRNRQDFRLADGGFGQR